MVNPRNNITGLGLLVVVDLLAFIEENDDREVLETQAFGQVQIIGRIDFGKANFGYSIGYFPSYYSRAVTELLCRTRR